jgi:hypothetical protein
LEVVTGALEVVTGALEVVTGALEVVTGVMETGVVSSHGVEVGVGVSLLEVEVTSLEED